MEMCGARTSRVFMKGMNIASLLVNLLPRLLESFRHLDYEGTVVVIVDYISRRC